MSAQRLELVGLGVGFVALFAALGSGPTVVLGRRLPARIALAPVVGFGLAASLLTSAALVMPMRVAAFVLLLPATLASLAVAAVSARRERPSAGDTAGTTAVVAAGLLLAVFPGIARDTVGPFSLAVFDGWGYIQTSNWLIDHSSRDALPAGAARFDLSSVVGHNFAVSDQRIGVEAVHGAVSALLGSGPDATLLAFLGALFALAPATIWALARALGAGPWSASFAALFGLSAALLTMVDDSTLANLAGVVLAPAALLLLVRSVADGSGEAALAAILLGGLISAYPEFVPPLVAVMAVGGIALVAIRAVRGALRRDWLLALSGRATIVAGLTALVAFHGVWRATGYLFKLSSDGSWALSLPPRWLTFENGGAWAFGVLHLYQLDRFDLLSEPKARFAIGLPLVLAALALAGAWRPLSRQAFFVLVPIAVAFAAGYGAHERYAEGHCEYCLWKSLTFMLPFLWLGVALGAHRVVRACRGGAALLTARVALATVAAFAAASVAYADSKLIRATYYHSYVPPALRTLDDSISRIRRPVHVLIEGADATITPPFDLPAAYYEARGLPERKVSFDAVSPAPAYLWIDRPPERYYSPNYTHVVTAFADVRSGRRLLARHGPYALFERAPIDVVVSRTGWTIDPTPGSRAIPWLTQPFELRIASWQAQRAALHVRLVRPNRDGSTLAFSQDGRAMGASRSGTGARLCVEVALRAGETVLRAESLLGSPAVVQPRPTESDPPPSPAKVLGLEAVEARPGRCPAPQDLPLVRYGEGWHQPEHAPGGVPFRWMGTTAELVIGEPGVIRPRLRLSGGVSSLAVPRRLTVRLGRKVLVSVSAPAPGGRQLALTLPAGRGPATLTFTAAPPAQPAATVNPADTRSLSVALVGVRVERI